MYIQLKTKGIIMDIIIKNVSLRILSDLHVLMLLGNHEGTDEALNHTIISGIIFEWLSSNSNELMMPYIIKNQQPDFIQDIEKFLIRAQETIQIMKKHYEEHIKEHVETQR